MKRVVYIFILISFLSEANTPAIIFKENKGQWPEKVLFGTEFLNTKFYINKTGFNYCVYNFEELSKAFTPPRKKNSLSPISETIVHGHNYEVNFEGANFTSFKMKCIMPEYYNYFLGNDKSKWASKVSSSKTIEFENIYNGIDLNIYSDDTNLEYDFIISPNTDPNQIKLNYNYIDGVSIRNGKLIINTSVGEITEQTPMAYQIISGKKINIQCEYVLKGNSVCFKFPEGYNKDFEVIIDPVVIVCSYSGTSSNSFAMTCNYDANGNIYTGGHANNGYPTTMGAFQVNGAGISDIFISAFNSTGTAKLFSTYIGGSYTGTAFIETAMDINVSATEITILGKSPSPDFPCTANAFDTNLSGANDLILTKLDVTGSNLIASTYIGGSSWEDDDQFWYYWQVNSEMIFDAQKNIYIVSNTTSADFPVTPGAISSTLSGPTDAVVFKMDPSLTNMIWSTYLGGTQTEKGVNIRLDGSGGVYVSGTTASADFPTTPGAYNQVSNSPTLEDLYISHINNTGTALISSTYLGTTSEDFGMTMDLDANNNVYMTGLISSISGGNLVPTPGTYSTQSANSIYKLDASLTTLGFKTLYGPVGSFWPDFYPTAMQVDSCGIIYLAGYAWGGHATTPGKFMSYSGGGSNIYMIIFDPNCSSLRFASYYGGNTPAPTGWVNMGQYAYGRSHFDDKGMLYFAVSATAGLLTTPGAYGPVHTTTVSTPKIFNDAFFKVDFQTYINPHSSYGNNIIGCPAPFTANFVGTTNTGTTFWNFGDGNTSVQDTISHTYLNFGTYNVLLVVTDTTTCNRTDSVKSILNVVPPISFDLGGDVYKCPNSTLLLQANATALSYSWSTGQTTQNISVNQSGTYTLTLFNGACYSSDEVTVLMGEEALNDKFPNVITPNNDGVNDQIDFSKYKFSEVEFTLYDRWGKQRYTTTDPLAKWIPDNLNNDTYFYVVNYKSNCTGKFATDKGFISVFK